MFQVWTNIINLLYIVETFRCFTFYMESRGLLSPHPSGFWKGRGTMDPVMCLETEVRKAQVNKEPVMAVFFDEGKRD